MDPFEQFKPDGLGEAGPQPCMVDGTTDGLAQRAAGCSGPSGLGTIEPAVGDRFSTPSEVEATAQRVRELEVELAALKAGAQSEAMAPNLGEIEPIVPLFGSERFKPHVLLQKELPHHRQICQLFAKGHTPSEVAQMTGFTNVTVNDVRKQPWALKYIAELMEKMGRKAVQSELQGATLDAARTMIKVMKGEIEGVKPCDQIKAAKEILDRQYGTAPANPPMEKVDLNDVTDEELVQTIRGQNN